MLLGWSCWGDGRQCFKPQVTGWHRGWYCHEVCSISGQGHLSQPGQSSQLTAQVSCITCYSLCVHM